MATEYKITALPALLAINAVDTDVIAIVNVSGDITNKMEVSELRTLMVTTTAVTSAGALMDSELTSIADVKALNQSVISGAAPVFDATNFTNLPSASPAGSDTQVQFNNAGAFGASANVTYDGTDFNIVAPNNQGLIVALSGAETNTVRLGYAGGGQGIEVANSNSKFYLLHKTATAGDFILNSQGRFTIGADGANAAQFTINTYHTTLPSQIINLANAQTANAFEINSFGGSGGDLLEVDKDGNINGTGKVSFSNSSFPVIEGVRYTASATGLGAGINLKRKTSNSVMYDGFGGGFVVSIGSSVVDAAYLGGYYASRSGADDKGKLEFLVNPGNGVTGALISKMVVDWTGYVGVGLAAVAPTAFMDLIGATTAAASLRLRDGTAPTSPNDGDVWQDGTNVVVRINGTSYTLDMTAV